MPCEDWNLGPRLLLYLRMVPEVAKDGTDLLPSRSKGHRSLNEGSWEVPRLEPVLRGSYDARLGPPTKLFVSPSPASFRAHDGNWAVQHGSFVFNGEILDPI